MQTTTEEINISTMYSTELAIEKFKYFEMDFPPSIDRY